MIGRLGKLEITDSQREGWLKEILSWRTSYDDTHPSPRRRIEALGEEPRIPHEFDTSAAEELLGDALAGLVIVFVLLFFFVLAESDFLLCFLFALFFIFVDESVVNAIV